MRHFLLVLAAAGVFFGFAGVARAQMGVATNAAPVRVKITVGKETTYVTDAAVGADGTIDYVKVYDGVIGRGVTEGNNLFVEVVKVLGPKGVFEKEVGEQARAEMLSRLGLKDLPEKGDYFLGPWGYFSGMGMSPKEFGQILDQCGLAERHSWKGEAYPEVADWLGHNEKALDELAEASLRERFYVPAVSVGGNGMEGLVMPSWTSLRDAATALAERAMWRLGEGKVDLAWKDVLAIHRLGHVLSNNGSVLGCMVGYAISNLGVRVDMEIISVGKLSAAQAKSYLADLEKLPKLGAVEDVVNNDGRLESLDHVMVAARGDGKNLFTTKLVDDEPVKEPIWGIDLSGEERGRVDWDAILRWTNQYYDAIHEAATKGTYAERDAALKKIEKDRAGAKMSEDALKKEPDLSKRVAGALENLMMHVGGQANIWYEEGLMEEQLDRVGFALAAYKAENWVYLDELDVLVPGYLQSIPADRFVDKPLHYGVQTGGEGFVLYSVGHDMKDDGGAETGEHRDTVFRVGK